MNELELRTILADLEKRTDTSWFEKLPDRKKDEILHHNKKRDKTIQAKSQDLYEMLHENDKFYTTIELSSKFLKDWMQEKVKGKVVLDYACGNGTKVIESAQNGAALAIGIDISDISVGNAKKAAQAAGVADRCFFVQGDCENTGLPADSIDVVLCTGVLHHMDLSYVFPEIRRILKPGGTALAVEALDYNPAVKLYRNMTPHLRTEWEKNHILSMKDLRFANRFFEVQNVRYWHLFSIVSSFFRKYPKLFRFSLNVFNRIDQVLMRIPGVRLMSWQFTFELVKRQPA